MHLHQPLHQQFTLSIPIDEMNLFEEITSDLVLSMWWDETGLVTGIIEGAHVEIFKDRIAPQTATFTPLENRDWLEEEQLQLSPIDIGIFTLFSPHHEISPRSGQTPLLINSGHAFGSGHHETTKMCLMALQDLRKQISNNKSNNQSNNKSNPQSNDKLNNQSNNKSNPQSHKHPSLKALDLGCGSGVLAIAIAKLWGESAFVIASDCDESAVKLTEENTIANHIKTVSIIQAEGFDHSELQKNGPYDLIVANIHSDPLIMLSTAMTKNLAQNGSVILSGILHEQEPQVINAYQNAGLNLVETLHENQWSTLILKVRRGMDVGA